MIDPLEDPVIREQVDRAVEPYLSVLSAEELTALRNLLATTLATHPALSRMVARLRPAPTVHTSGAVKSGDEPQSETQRAARRRAGTGRSGR